MALWPAAGDLFATAARSRETLEDAATRCLQKHAHGQKVAGSSPKTSRENAVSMRHKRGLTHLLADDTERHFSSDPSALTSSSWYC